ncbi:luciferase [Steroidobacter denitrificans]|uniref:Luciferase n=1 Tax=Steroidobacter denitrificans TaxID=465721 RepID=A0A127FD40_STEDE|nr:luciferase [Steroidobacter denitrificans]
MNSIHIGFVPIGARPSVRELEGLPIDSLWTGGHVAAPNGSPEAMIGLARLAALSSRVQVGTMVLLLPLYPPAIVAKQIADLDRASGGRIVLGVGVGGEYPEEFRACQVPIGERGPRTDEAITLIRRLWSGAPVTHDGRFYPMDSVRIHPAPIQAGGPPIVVAGREPPAMRRAATLGDGWCPYLYSPERYARSATSIREFAANHGRALDGFGWYVWVFCNVGTDGRLAREQAARSLGGNYAQDFRAMIERVAAAGTADEVLERLCAFYDAGARHFILCPATGDAEPGSMIDRLFTDVVPRLRAYASVTQAAHRDT